MISQAIIEVARNNNVRIESRRVGDLHMIHAVAPATGPGLIMRSVVAGGDGPTNHQVLAAVIAAKENYEAMLPVVPVQMEFGF